jgi:hypothetical protein
MQEPPAGDNDPRPEDEEIQLDESQELPGSDERFEGLDSERSDIRAGDR